MSDMGIGVRVVHEQRAMTTDEAVRGIKAQAGENETDVVVFSSDHGHIEEFKLYGPAGYRSTQTNDLIRGVRSRDPQANIARAEEGGVARVASSVWQASAAACGHDARAYAYGSRSVARAVNSSKDGSGSAAAFASSEASQATATNLGINGRATVCAEAPGAIGVADVLADDASVWNFCTKTGTSSVAQAKTKGDTVTLTDRS